LFVSGLNFYLNPPRSIPRMATAPMIMMPTTTSPRASQILVWVLSHVVFASVLHSVSGVMEPIRELTTMIPTRISTIVVTRAKTMPCPPLCLANFLSI